MSDPEYRDCDDEFSCDVVKKNASKLLKMSPNEARLKSDLKGNLISIVDLRKSLEKVTTKERKKSNRNADRRKIEDCFWDITSDISTKLENIARVVIGALDRMHQIAERLDALEGFVGDHNEGTTYASVAMSGRNNEQVNCCGK